MKNTVYECKAGTLFRRKFKTNFDSVHRFVYKFTPRDFEVLFKDGMEFAISFIENQKLCEHLHLTKQLKNLVFGVNELDLVRSIADPQGPDGYKYVNIEYWTILIYFYYLLQQEDNTKFYQPPQSNLFFSLLKLGDKDKSILDPKMKNNLFQHVAANGFNTYYRLLMSSAI